MGRFEEVAAALVSASLECGHPDKWYLLTWTGCVHWVPRLQRRVNLVKSAWRVSETNTDHSLPPPGRTLASVPRERILDQREPVMGQIRV